MTTLVNFLIALWVVAVVTGIYKTLKSIKRQLTEIMNLRTRIEELDSAIPQIHIRFDGDVEQIRTIIDKEMDNRH
jgi:predicted PurR-regulated permease PerM